MTSIKKVLLIFKSNIFEMPIVRIIAFFDKLVLVTSIPSETSVLLYSSTFYTFNLYKVSSRKLVDKLYHLLQKQN